jgi:hypothetical protein
MSISTIKPTDKTVDQILDDIPIGIGYFHNGQTLEKTTLSNPECLAKQITIDNNKGGKKHKYYILFSIEAQLFNPWGLYSKNKVKNYLERSGRSFWNFKEVKEQTFNRYLRFLETRNESHLNICERETKDA